MYPRLTYDLTKIKQNLDVVSKVVKGAGCSLMIVTKSFCADPALTAVIAAHPSVDYLADSRIENLKKYPPRDSHESTHDKETVLLRLPQEWEIADVVRYADISFNSECKTVQLLQAESARQDKIHKIVLMVDLGDLREGIFYQQEEAIYHAVEEILTFSNVQLLGIGVNLTCYGAIVPKHDNLSKLVEIANNIEEKFSIHLPMITGGNSSSFYLIGREELPQGINNLRLGEAFILGNETAYGARIPDTYDDAALLEAQIIELQTKPSLPIGEIGKDAFGETPSYEDRGYRKRAILAIGKQDADIGSMTPLDPKVGILGASSDHLILDVTDSENAYQVGSVVGFKLGYGGLLKAATSPYVFKAYECS